MSRTCVFLVAMSILSCKTGRTPENPSQLAEKASAPEGQPSRILLQTPITFDVGERLVHSPMVHVNFGGTMTKLILDTGSTDHVLTIELANRVGLESAPTEPGTDHAGASVPSWTLGEVAVSIENSALHLHDTIAIKGPEPFERWDIGGFLSPQNLHPSAFVVIDLVDNMLILLECDAPDLAPWLERRYPALHRHSLDREPGATVLVQASIEPFDRVLTMLNTGGTQTEFARVAVPELRGTAPQTLGRGVSGKEVHGEEVADQTLRVGDARFPVPVLLVREQMDPPYGLVGTDILKGTVLVVSADMNQPAQWLVAPPGR